MSKQFCYHPLVIASCVCLLVLLVGEILRSQSRVGFTEHGWQLEWQQPNTEAEAIMPRLTPAEQMLRPLWDTADRILNSGNQSPDSSLPYFTQTMRRWINTPYSVPVPLFQDSTVSKHRIVRLVNMEILTYSRSFEKAGFWMASITPNHDTHEFLSFTEQERYLKPQRPGTINSTLNLPKEQISQLTNTHYSLALLKPEQSSLIIHFHNSEPIPDTIDLSSLDKSGLEHILARTNGQKWKQEWQTHLSYGTDSSEYHWLCEAIPLTTQGHSRNFALKQSGANIGLNLLSDNYDQTQTITSAQISATEPYSAFLIDNDAPNHDKNQTGATIELNRNLAANIPAQRLKQLTIGKLEVLESDFGLRLDSYNHTRELAHPIKITNTSTQSVYDEQKQHLVFTLDLNHWTSTQPLSINTQNSPYRPDALFFPSDSITDWHAVTSSNTYMDSFSEKGPLQLKTQPEYEAATVLPDITAQSPPQEQTTNSIIFLIKSIASSPGIIAVLFFIITLYVLSRRPENTPD